MRITEAMICWNPGTDQVVVVPWPDTEHSTRAIGLPQAVGACDMDLHDLPEYMQIAMVFIHFHTLVVRDKVPVEAAHRAFLTIDEYRQHMSEEIEGALSIPEDRAERLRVEMKRNRNSYEELHAEEDAKG